MSPERIRAKTSMGWSLNKDEVTYMREPLKEETTYK